MAGLLASAIADGLSAHDRLDAFKMPVVHLIVLFGAQAFLLLGAVRVVGSYRKAALWSLGAACALLWVGAAVLGLPLVSTVLQHIRLARGGDDVAGLIAVVGMMFALVPILQATAAFALSLSFRKAVRVTPDRA